MQVSDEGRMDEIDSYALILIEKFLTSKPFNRKAAKNTLWRAWGLDKELQISKVGMNLFQFKFQSEYELERIFRGGPWTFNNQLLMLTRWRKGMSANNVVLEHASLQVQIWGVPFNMMSPNVATKVGNKMGMVEDVECRRRMDDQNSFLRVRVALPISKPLRRGGFLLGLDGKRHWVTYKYERMPIFCHYCGILGHVLRHCLAHFEESKKENPINYQYGDWLKVDNGQSKSPPRRNKDSPPRAESMGRTDGPVKESSEIHEMATAATRVPTHAESQKSQNGSHGSEGIVLEIQEKILEDIATQNSNRDTLVPKLPLTGDLYPNLNVDANSAPNTFNLGLGHTESEPTRPKSMRPG